VLTEHPRHILHSRTCQRSDGRPADSPSLGSFHTPFSPNSERSCISASARSVACKAELLASASGGIGFYAIRNQFNSIEIYEHDNIVASFPLPAQIQFSPCPPRAPLPSSRPHAYRPFPNCAYGARTGLQKIHVLVS